MDETSLSNLRMRVYTEGFRPSDFDDMKPGNVVVEPVRPPGKSAGGVYTGPAAENVPGTGCLFYRVVATSKEHPPGNLKHEPGDVVVLRQAHLDPMNGSQTFLWIKSDHLLAKYAREHVEPAVKPPAPTLLVPDTRIVLPE